MNALACRKTRTLLALCLAAIASNAIRAAETAAPAVPLVEVRATDSTALEGASSAAFTLTRSGATTSGLTVNYSLSGTASNGVDYVQLNTSATIPAGLKAANITITPILNPLNTGRKTVILTLLTNSNYSVREHRSASVSIVDDSFNNQAPTVTLVNPTNATVFAFPATITLRAEASDNDGAIAKVSFYANDDFLGQATNSPYTFVWTNAHTGKYALFARATDALEKSTLSAPVHITVTNILPTIRLLSPTNGSIFPVKSNVKLLAEASAVSGPVTKVQFYRDSRFLGSVTNPPYSLTWSNVAPGKHTVTARVIDSAGSSASATSHFTVTNAAPIVSITSPTNGAAFKAHSNITVQATATDSDGPIAKVSFYANERFLGRASASPFQVTWTNAPAGNHKLSAIATDEFGEDTRSKSVTISVK